MQSVKIVPMLPKHIAIIPDGNRRWAKEKNLPVFEGHRRGYQRVKEISRKAREMGIETITFWAFSTENWKRTKTEVGYLMKLFEKIFEDSISECLKDEVRLLHIGRKDRLSQSLKKKIETAEEQTRKFKKSRLVIALDYGGRDEIVRALNNVVKSSHKGVITTEQIDAFIDTKNLPDPDLIIRTGGEKRTSGFLLWQSEYAEYFFSDKYFPDFTVEDFENAIKDYEERQRRFGK